MQMENSNKNLVLIIPDLHLRHKQAEKIISHVKPGEIIFIGDYFDSFVEDPNAIRATAEWFTWSIHQPNRIMVTGNHEMSYAFASRWFICSGYAQWKDFIINDIVERKDWDKLKYYYILDGKWLLSHGGLHKFHLPDNIAKLHTDRPLFLQKIQEYLDTEIIKGHRNESWIFRAGYSRGGDHKVGGITWCDFDREFYPIKGLNQLFGHTPQDLGFAKWCYLKGNSHVTYHPINLWMPKPEDYDNVQRSYNIDLDVHGNMHWAIWNGKSLSFGNYQDNFSTS